MRNFTLPPQSLRNRLVLLMVAAVVLPILAAGYVISLKMETALVAEKREKLFGAARLLDAAFPSTYQALLEETGTDQAEREVKIALLNRELGKITDQVAAAYTGIGVGYYSKELDAIITYGPSHIYADKVGLAIGSDHQGRIVMATGVPRVQHGKLVRGDIMNAMLPIIRNDEVIGYIWANELTSDILASVTAIRRHIYFAILAGLIVGIAGIIYVVQRFALDVHTIKEGLLRLRGDLTYQMPQLAGEMRVIIDAIHAMAKDLAAKRRLEEQVQKAERLAAVGEVAAGLAHEIRNPLMAIKGFAELLHEDLEDPVQRENVSVIIQEAERMNVLIGQLLCFARPPAAELVPVRLNEVIHSTLRLMQNKTARRSIAIHCDLSDAPPVQANDEQLKQVLLNIIINAIQAIQNQGEIRISTEAADFRVLVRIADNGAGILPENLEKIFEPFFTTKEDGTGLGLSVAQRLMDAWGGSLRAESTEGQGSVFTLSFPVRKAVRDNDQ